MADDDMTDFVSEIFTADNMSFPIYLSGSGPAVIVIAEMPGITPKVLGFARTVRDRGFTVILPHLFGSAGRDTTIAHNGKIPAWANFATTVIKACVRKEFITMATGQTSPIVSWLRALGREMHDRCGGPGIGAVGMCFTGGFTLAMATDERLLVPVMSQPSLPLALSETHRHDLGTSLNDLTAVQKRCASEDLEVIGLRFRGDGLVPGSRFDSLRRLLGDNFIALELDPAAANPAAETPPHSVLTEHLINEPGEPTHDALNLVLDHLVRKLQPA